MNLEKRKAIKGLFILISISWVCFILLTFLPPSFTLSNYTDNYLNDWVFIGIIVAVLAIVTFGVFLYLWLTALKLIKSRLFIFATFEFLLSVFVIIAGVHIIGTSFGVFSYFAPIVLVVTLLIVIILTISFFVRLRKFYKLKQSES